MKRNQEILVWAHYLEIRNIYGNKHDKNEERAKKNCKWLAPNNKNWWWEELRKGIAIFHKKPDRTIWFLAYEYITYY